MGYVDYNAFVGVNDGKGFGYSEEEWMLKKNVREFCETEMEPRWQEAYNPETQNAFYHEMIAKIGEKGWLRVVSPEKIGGFGLSFVSKQIITEELSRVASGVAIQAGGQMTYANSMAMNVPAAFEIWGQGVLDGTILIAGTSCSPEGQINYKEQANIGTFDEETNEWVLNGSKAYSSGGPICDLLRIMGLVDGTIHHWYVEPAKTPGLTMTINREMGCSPSASWNMKNVRIPKELGARVPIVVNREIQTSGPDLMSFGTAVLSIGAMDAAFEKTVEYLKVRTHNGRPIASLASMQYKLAVMKGKIEAARAFFRQTQIHVLNNSVQAPVISRLVKPYVCDVGREITSECVGMWGCLGYNEDTGITRHLADCLGHGIGCGTSDEVYMQAAYEMGLPGAEKLMP